MADNSKQFSADDFDLLNQNDRSKLDDEKIAAPSLTFLQDSWRRLRKNKAAMIALVLLVILFVLSFGSGLLPLSPYNYQYSNYTNLPPKIPGIDINGFNGTIMQGGVRVNAYVQNHVPSNVYFLLGTDGLGRDLFARILYGTRISLTIAVVASFFDLAFGVVYGIISGWIGGRTDTIMQRIIEILLSIPNLVVMILFLVVLKPGLLPIILAIALTSWINMARLVRAETLELKEQEFVLAARTLGESSFKIAFKHLLPNLSSIIIINLMFTIPGAIFFEAFLAWIGIGVPSPAASLGTLISDGQKNFQFLPYQMWYPALVLVIIMLAFNILGDGLRDAFDPRSRR